MIDHLSCSQITGYLMCAYKYRLKYVDKVEPAGKPVGLALGSVVHSTIEWLHQQRMAGEIGIELEEVLQIFEADWEALKAGGVPLLADEDSEGDLVAQGKALLQVYFENPSPNPVVQVEVPFRHNLVHPETGEELAVPLEGRIDQVEENPETGKHTVVELKTAARRYSADDLVRHLQPTLYQWAIETETGESPDLRIDVLLKTKKPQILRHPVQRSTRDRVKFFDLAGAVLDGIEKGVFPANPGWGCAGCEYGHVCQWGSAKPH